VGYEDAERQLFLPSTDLSETGIFLLCADPPNPGQRARLLFELPGAPELVRLGGVVVRRAEIDPRGFAVRFEREALSESVRRALRSYVTQGKVSGTR
jgi:hypothetical protein